MEVARLQRQWTRSVATMRTEKILDEQFIEIRKLQDESTPKVVFELFSIFFETSAELIRDLSKTIRKKIVDFELMYSRLHQLKGSSESVGAMRIRDACLALRTHCAVKNIEMCEQWLLQLKYDWSTLENKMDALFALEAKIGRFGGTVPSLD